MDSALDDYFLMVVAGVCQQTVTPVMHRFVNGCLQLTAAIPHPEAPGAEPAFAQPLERQANGAEMLRLLEGAMKDGLLGPIADRLAELFQPDGCLPVFGVIGQVIIQVLRMRQGDDVAVGILLNGLQGSTIQVSEGHQRPRWWSR